MEDNKQSYGSEVMKGLKVLKITNARRTDLEQILTLQHLSYQSEAALYNDYTIQPLTQTIADLKKEHEEQIILIAVINDILVGSVRACIKGDTCHIGKLIVHPDFQNRGIGSHLMKEVEQLFPESNRFELYTGHKSTKNIYLYNKLGYEKFMTSEIHKNLTLIFMEKYVSA